MIIRDYSFNLYLSSHLSLILKFGFLIMFAIIGNYANIDGMRLFVFIFSHIIEADL